MKIDAINKQHAGYLKDYIKGVQEIMFDATERTNIGKISEINDLLSNTNKMLDELDSIGELEDLLTNLMKK